MALSTSPSRPSPSASTNAGSGKSKANAKIARNKTAGGVRCFSNSVANRTDQEQAPSEPVTTVSWNLEGTRLVQKLQFLVAAAVDLASQALRTAHTRLYFIPGRHRHPNLNGPTVVLLVVDYAYYLVYLATPNKATSGPNTSRDLRAFLWILTLASKRRTNSLFIQRIRTSLFKILTPTYSASQIRRESITLPQGVKLEWFTPINTAAPLNDYYLLHAHGGGFVTGSVAAYEGFICNLALQLNVPVISLDYKLAPESPYPAQVDEFAVAYQWLLEEKRIPSQKISFIGDSAGGNIVFTALWRHAEKFKNRLPRSVVGLCPAFDFTHRSIFPTVTHKPSAEFYDPILPVHHLESYIQLNNMKPLAGEEKNSISYLADYSFLPKKAMISVSYSELLYTDSKEFADRVNKKVGKELIELRSYEGCPHDWHMFFKYVPEARQANSDVFDFLRKAHQN